MALLILQKEICLKEQKPKGDPGHKVGLKFGGDSPNTIDDFFQLLDDLWEGVVQAPTSLDVSMTATASAESVQVTSGWFAPYDLGYSNYFRYCDGDPVGFGCDSPSDPLFWEEGDCFSHSWTCPTCDWINDLDSGEMGQSVAASVSEHLDFSVSTARTENETCPLYFSFVSGEDNQTGTVAPTLFPDGYFWWHFESPCALRDLVGNPTQGYLRVLSAGINLMEVYGDTTDWGTVTEITVPVWINSESRITVSWQGGNDGLQYTLACGQVFEDCGCFWSAEPLVVTGSGRVVDADDTGGDVCGDLGWSQTTFQLFGQPVKYIYCGADGGIDISFT